MFYIHYLWALSETYRLKVCLCSVWVFCNAETVLIFTFSISSILPPHSPWYFLISLLHPFICTTQSQPESRFTQKEIYPFYIYLFSKTIFPVISPIGGEENQMLITTRPQTFQKPLGGNVSLPCSVVNLGETRTVQPMSGWTFISIHIVNVNDLGEILFGMKIGLQTADWRLSKMFQPHYIVL